jgi:mortality factor 4-like protein 1
MESPPFQVDDRVLCHQENGDTYEGVVRNAKYDPLGSTAVGQQRWSFFIHFNGWNARHDKWVTADRILKQQHHQGEYPHNISSSSSTNRKRTLSDDDSNNNNNNNNNIENDNCQNPPPPPAQQRSRKKRVARGGNAVLLQQQDQQQLTILPFTLKTVLVEELECITVRRWLHRLPAAVPIRKLLNHFRNKKKQHDGTNNNDAGRPNADEFCQNIVEIFQHALPKCLLYEQEQPQFAALLAAATNNDHSHHQPTAPPAPTQWWVDVYGCEYLLRLAVQVPPPLLPQASTYFAELLVLMQKNKAALFPSTLVSSSSSSSSAHQSPNNNANYMLATTTKSK